MNLTVKSIPDELHQKLRERAKDNGRSLNKEVIKILESSIGPTRVDRAELMKRIEERHNRLSINWTEDDINRMKREGRE